MFWGIVPERRFEEKWVETPSIRAFRGMQELGDPQTTVEVELNDPYAAVEQQLGSILRAVGDTSTTFHQLYPPEFPGPARYPTVRLEGARLKGVGSTEAVQLDLELLANSVPYENMADLYLDFGLPQDNAGEDASSTIEIILAPVAEIDVASELKGDTLSLSVNAAPDINRKLVRAGIKAFGRSALQRFSLTGDKFAWRRDGSLLRASLDIPLPDTPISFVSLSYNGEALHRLFIKDKSRSFNSKLEIQRAVDSNDVFRETFFEQKTDFEERINVLLSLLGLNTLFYGQIPLLTDAPDILAMSGQGHLYVVECTTGDINAKGKLQRLYDRSKAIKAALEGSPARPTVVQPIVFTSSPRQETSAHWSVAESLKIALAAREEIAWLLNQIEAPPTDQKLYEGAFALIPNATPQH